MRLMDSPTLGLSVGEVAALSGLTEAQLRYWDGLGLVPARHAETVLGMQSHRRYAIPHLRRLIAVKALMTLDWSPKQIVAAIQTIGGDPDQQTVALRQLADRLSTNRGKGK